MGQEGHESIRWNPDVADARNRLGIGPVHAHRVVVSEGLHRVAEFAEPVDLAGRDPGRLPRPNGLTAALTERDPSTFVADGHGSAKTQDPADARRGPNLIVVRGLT